MHGRLRRRRAGGYLSALVAFALGTAACYRADPTDGWSGEETWEVRQSAHRVAVIAHTIRNQTGRCPDLDELVAEEWFTVESTSDIAGRRFRLECGEGYALATSAGFDGEFGTDDDLTGKADDARH
ncbi:MAG: hypothetical protein VYE22_36355 [Myxococcota bacterium]|nr:hypothetical protein [Myxococcota bacterium]